MSWPTVKLEDVFEIVRGGSPRPIDQYITEESDGLNWISIKDASNSGKYITKTKLKIKKEGLSKSRLVKPGDFLLTNSMSFGRPYIMKTSGCIHDGWLALTGDPEKVDADFFYYLLGSNLLKSKFAALAKGAVVKNLNINLVKGVQIPLPPLETQKQIAAVLEKADQLRKDCQQMEQELNNLAQSVFIDMFGDPVTNPKGWDVLTIGELTSKVTDGEHQTPKRAESGYKLLSARNVQHGYLDVVNEKVDYVGEAEFERITKRLLIENSDVLLSCSGTIGRAAMNTLNEPFCLVRSVAVIRLVQEHMLPEFLVGYLATSYMQAVMHHEANSSGQPNLFQNQIKKLKVYCPPIKSQKKFKTFIESQKTKLIQLKVLRGEYDEAFNALMQKAFKGDLNL